MIERIKSFFVHIVRKSDLTANIGIIAVLCLLSVVIYDVTKTEVTVSADGESFTVETHAGTVGDVLAEQDIDLIKHDDVEPPLSAEVEEGLIIEYVPAQHVNVSLDGSEEEVWTTVDTVDELMEELDVAVSSHDEVEPSLHAQIEDGMTIAYEEAFPVRVVHDGESSQIWTVAATVEDVLDEQNIDLGEMDQVEPDIDETLTADADVTITRVDMITETIEESVSFATVRENDDSLEAGTERVEQEGERGTLQKTYEVVLEDGEEVSRELIEEEVVEESSDRIIAVGTMEQETVSRGRSSASEERTDKEEPAAEETTASSERETETAEASSSSQEEASSSSGTEAASSSSSSSESSSSSSENESSSSSSSSESESSGSSWESFQATAYTASCNGCSGVTATGVDLKANPNANVIAVDPSVIPLGSKVEVKGHGTFTAADTGGAINGNKIDIFMSDRGSATSFGRQSVQVRVVD
ncbi:ubiquitin-like domain-containing protein [Alkalicoccus luteus]|uniref:ubiquitin-like domain-containing protein n=1 Tax=Alkalicoccus luteus TaxID=1237094 RepID=UPI00403338BB